MTNGRTHAYVARIIPIPDDAVDPGGRRRAFSRLVGLGTSNGASKS
jgi:hypothetical protein